MRRDLSFAKLSAVKLSSVLALGGLLCACATPPTPLAPDLLAFEPGEAPAPSASAASVGLNTPIAGICAYPGGREVLQRELPGLVDRPEYMFFKTMTLVQLRPLSRGRITADDLARVRLALGKLSTASRNAEALKSARN